MAGKAIGQAEIELVLRKAVKKEVDVKNYQFVSFDSFVGFMGDHHTLVVNYSEANSENKEHVKEHSFFVKQIPDSERYRKIILGSGLFAKEQEMYQKLLPLLAKNLQQKLPVAECYLIGDESYVMIFEDLQRMGYKLADKYAYLEVRQCEAAFRAIALLHAGSVATEIKTGKLMPFHADHCYEALIADNKSDNIVLRQWHYSSLKTTFGLLQKMQRYKSRLAGVNWDAVYQRLYLAWEECAVAAAGNSSKFKNVLSHGDLWVNNVLFRGGAQGAVDALLVDFQAYRYAPPVIDLLMFLHVTTSRQFRTQHQRDLLKFYYQALVQFLNEAGICKEEIPFSFQELERSAHEFKSFAVIIAAR